MPEDTSPAEQPAEVGAAEQAPGRFARWKADATARFEHYRGDHAWLQHTIAAWQLLQRNNGNQFAAAITYFSFLAVFPMLLLAGAVAGYVLSADPSLEHSLFQHVAEQIPGEFGRKINDSLQAAIDNRAGVGIIGLAGVLLTGLGWIGNLRQAIDAVWGRPQPKRNFVVSRLLNLVVLGGLGLGLLVSLGLTAVGTSLTSQVSSAIGFDSVPGSVAILKVVGVAVAVLGDMVIFWWLLVKLPQAEVSRRVSVQAALLASLGLEGLKILGTYTIAHAAKSPTAGPFASIIAVLVWAQLVARLLLYTCAWMAVRAAAEREAVTPDAEPAEVVRQQPAGPNPGAVGASLVGVGAVAGAMAGWALRRPRGERRSSAPRRSRQPW